VALQRKAVKTDDSLGRPNLPPKGLQSGKELLRKGARGVQTLYMTERMQTTEKPRATANQGAVLFQALIDGSY
jgi:hypothetical protein